MKSPRAARIVNQRPSLIAPLLAPPLQGTAIREHLRPFAVSSGASLHKPQQAGPAVPLAPRPVRQSTPVTGPPHQGGMRPVMGAATPHSHPAGCQTPGLTLDASRGPPHPAAAAPAQDVQPRVRNSTAAGIPKALAPGTPRPQAS
ncbi:hypothetical protein NDU88_001742 [Pleurodeles waltl]|uniref:Uncharacterized protein n=1 Tax=Pleurodeles waltl TaxID=8319 RepID=A0AAV7MVH5_PLEWA|nr:hypothetical protein NDU88_001742 [Pleurodeles waltl]